jgi:small subunit ribosomal protein S4e
MTRGPKKHLKRINAPKSWMLNKLGGIWATRPSQGPHKLRESLPLSVLLKERLNYALNGRDVTLILNDKEQNVLVDGKVRRDRGFPTGLMDVVRIEKTDETFRVLYDTKGRFILKALNKEDAKFKLLKVTSKAIGTN